MSTYARTAPHIRGRVFLARPKGTHCRRALWGMEIVNTRSGDILATDNCTDLTRLLRECHEATAIARGAWFWGYRQQALK